MAAQSTDYQRRTTGELRATAIPSARANTRRSTRCAARAHARGVIARLEASERERDADTVAQGSLQQSSLHIELNENSHGSCARRHEASRPWSAPSASHDPAEELERNILSAESGLRNLSAPLHSPCRSCRAYRGDSRNLRPQSANSNPPIARCSCARRGTCPRTETRASPSKFATAASGTRIRDNRASSVRNDLDADPAERNCC